MAGTLLKSYLFTKNFKHHTLKVHSNIIVQHQQFENLKSAEFLNDRCQKFHYGRSTAKLPSWRMSLLFQFDEVLSTFLLHKFPCKVFLPSNTLGFISRQKKVVIVNGHASYLSMLAIWEIVGRVETKM